jgi:hypothetical protein
MRHAVVIGTGIAFLVIALTAALFVWISQYEHQRAASIAPPPNITNVFVFLKWRPETGSFVIIERTGEEYLMTNGLSRGVLASGPSAYVFDRTGQMVDWSYDIGDDPAFDEKWRAQHSMRGTRIISSTDVNKWIASKSSE